MIVDLLGRIFTHAQALSVDFHQRYTSGRLTSRATSDVQALRNLLANGLPDIAGALLTTVYISAMLLYLDPTHGRVLLDGVDLRHLGTTDLRRAVVILDEATPSLDIPGERLVHYAMTTVLHGRTALVIAHRLSTVHIAVGC